MYSDVSPYHYCHCCHCFHCCRCPNHQRWCICNDLIVECIAERMFDAPIRLRLALNSISTSTSTAHRSWHMPLLQFSLRPFSALNSHILENGRVYGQKMCRFYEAMRHVTFMSFEEHTETISIKYSEIDTPTHQHAHSNSRQQRKKLPTPE